MWTQVQVRLLFFRQKHTLARSSCSGTGTRLLRNDYIVPRPNLQRTMHGSQVCMWAWQRCCGLNALLAECYPFQLSISAFRFSFQFQLSVSSVSTCPKKVSILSFLLATVCGCTHKLCLQQPFNRFTKWFRIPV